MTSAEILKRIELLPPNLQQEVADYVVSLSDRYHRQQRDPSEFELVEIEQQYAKTSGQRHVIRMIHNRLGEIYALCRQYRVKTLYVFGSATTGQFTPAKSDLDFLVTYEALEPHELLDAFMGLAEALEQLFHRPVDLVIENTIKNPYFKEEVEETRVKLYEA